jgi:hypothetical protein
VAKPGRECTICASPEIALKADGLLASQYSLVEIATELGVSKFTVSRHKRHSALKLTEAEAKQLPEDRLETLYDRCDQLFQSLAAAGDAKAAADILKTQARLAEAAVARAETKAETLAETAATSDVPTPQQFDNVRKKVFAAYAKWVEHGYVFCQFCGSRKPVPPEVLEKNIKAFMESQHVNSNVN